MKSIVQSLLGFSSTPARRASLLARSGVVMGLVLVLVLVTADLLAAGSGASSNVPDRKLLNIDFTAEPHLKTGPAAVGQTPNDYWNVYSRDVDSPFHWRDNGQLSGLKWADGSSSPAILSVTNAAGAWGNGSTDAMFQVYLYPLSRMGDMTVTLTGVPAGLYDLYFYAHGQPDSENGVVQVSSAGRDYGTQTNSSAPGWNPPAWTEGKQFVLFRGVEAVSGQALTITIEPGTAGLAVMNGLQLISRSSVLTGDGIPDSWRQQFFGPGFASDPRAAATADPDGDGANNYQESLAGTNPLDPASVQTVPLYVSTFAGAEPGGKDGPRAEATFLAPSSLTFDAAGRLWITEATFIDFAATTVGANRIRVVGVDQVVRTVAGSAEPGLVDGQGLSARFSGPHKVAFDHQGNAFVADTANHRIRKIDASGVVSTFAGSEAGYRDGVGTEAMFHTPNWVVSDTSDNLFVADFENLRIRKISPQGVVTTYAGGVRGAEDGPLTIATFNSPNALAFAPDGSLLVSDWSNGKIRRIKDGLVTTFATGPAYIDGMNSDPQGNIYAAFNGAHFLAKYSPDGTVSWTIPTGQGFEDGPIASAKFSDAVGAPLPLPDGNLLVYDVFNNRIRKITVGVPPLLTVSPAAGLFSNSVTVSVSSAVGAAVTHYTLNGTEPGPDSPIYSGPITLQGSTIIKARLFVNGVPVSDTLSAAFKDANAPVSGPIRVSTYAGSVPGSQDGFRTDATFTYPATLALAPDGRIFVTEANLPGSLPQATRAKHPSDWPDGMVTTFAGMTTPAW